MSESIAKNTSFLTLGMLTQKILAIIFFIIIARYYPLETVGKYIFAMSFSAMFGIFIDLGLTSVLTRECAWDGEKTEAYLGNTLAVKLILSLVVYAVIIIAVAITKPDDAITRELVYLGALAMIVDIFSNTFYGVLRGHQILKYEALGIVVSQLLVLILGLIAISNRWPIGGVILSIMTGNLFNLFYSFFLVKNKLKIKFKLYLKKNVIISLMGVALPFTLIGIFNRLYSYIDSVLLSMLSTDTNVAWYGAAYKIAFSLAFIPAAFGAALFPAFSANYIHAKDKLARNFEKAMYYLLILAIPIAVGVAILSKEIILFIYHPEYLASGFILKLLIISLVFVFLSYPAGSLLMACNRQKTQTVICAAVLLVNVILNIILIPYWAHLGATIATLICNFLTFILPLYFIRQVIDYDGWFIWRGFYKDLFAAVLMGIIIYLIKDYLPILITVGIGAVIYGILIYGLQGITRNDLNYIKDSFFRKNIE